MLFQFTIRLFRTRPKLLLLIRQFHWSLSGAGFFEGMSSLRNPVGSFIAFIFLKPSVMNPRLWKASTTFSYSWRLTGRRRDLRPDTPDFIGTRSCTGLILLPDTPDFIGTGAYAGLRLRRRLKFEICDCRLVALNARFSGG